MSVDVGQTTTLTLVDAEGDFCRDCATQIGVCSSGVLKSHAAAGRRVRRAAGRPACTGSNRPGWPGPFRVVHPRAPIEIGELTTTTLCLLLGVDRTAISMLHHRDLIPLPTAILREGCGPQFVYPMQALTEVRAVLSRVAPHGIGVV